MSHPSRIDTDEVARDVHHSLSSKLKCQGSDGAAAGTPRPSPREGAVKISQVVVGRGLVDVGGDDDDDDDDDDAKDGAAGGGVGLLGQDYASDGDSEDEGGKGDKAPGEGAALSRAVQH